MSASVPPVLRNFNIFEVILWNSREQEIHCLNKDLNYLMRFIKISRHGAMPDETLNGCLLFIQTPARRLKLKLKSFSLSENSIETIFPPCALRECQKWKKTEANIIKLLKFSFSPQALIYLWDYLRRFIKTTMIKLDSKTKNNASESIYSLLECLMLVYVLVTFRDFIKPRMLQVLSFSSLSKF